MRMGMEVKEREDNEGDGDECRESGPSDAGRVIWALGMFFFDLFIFYLLTNFFIYFR